MQQEFTGVCYEGRKQKLYAEIQRVDTRPTSFSAEQRRCATKIDKNLRSYATIGYR